MPTDLRWSKAQVVQGVGQFPAVALAGAAGAEVGQDRGEAEPLGRVVDAAGRDQEVERRRADVLHALGEQGQAVGERVLVDVPCGTGTP